MEEEKAGTTAAAPKPELTFVEFEGPDDPLHPWNWPIGKRYVYSSKFEYRQS